MRNRISVCLLTAAVAAWCSGCVMVIGVKEPATHEQVVVMDGEFHVVNTKTHRIRKIEVEPVAEEETAVDIEVSDGR